MSRKLERGRREYPVTAESIYLSTGSWGPVSRIYSSTLRRLTLVDLREGRMSDERFAAMDEATSAIRATLATLIGANPASLALTRSTSAALETVINGLPFRDGDEIVCTQLEHPACTEPLRELARRQSVSVRLAQVPEQDAANLSWLEKCVTPRTRLIALTGVSYTTGQRLPIEAVGAFGRERGIRTLLDAAQCIGAMPLDLPAAGIDFCGFPLQKWLSGPEGMGALYVRDDDCAELRRDRLSQSRGVLAATAAHLDWLAATIGWEFIFRRTRELAGQARAQLADIADVRMVTPDDHAGLVTFESPQAFSDISGKLDKARIVLRSWPDQGRFRLSTAWFNTAEEVETVARVFRPRRRSARPR